MNQNLSASIHNRVSTLCQAYVKYRHPEDWAKLRAKAEDEYKNQARRRNTKADLEECLNAKFIPVLTPKTIKTDEIASNDNYWGDPVNTMTCKSQEDNDI